MMKSKGFSFARLFHNSVESGDQPITDPGDMNAPSTRRMIAWGLDVAIAGVIANLLNKILGNSFQDPIFGPLFCYALSAFVYGTLTEGTTHHASLGKRLMRIRVCNVNGGSPTLLTAAWRNALKSLFFMTVGLSYAFAFLHTKRQALHDLGSFTRVVTASANTSSLNVGGSSRSKISLAVAAALSLVSLMVTSILAMNILAVAHIRSQVHSVYQSTSTVRDQVATYVNKNGHAPSFTDIGINADGTVLNEPGKRVDYLPEGSFVISFPGHTTISGAMHVSMPGDKDKPSEKQPEWRCTSSSGFSIIFIPGECSLMIFHAVKQGQRR